MRYSSIYNKGKKKTERTKNFIESFPVLRYNNKVNFLTVYTILITILKSY